MHTLNLKKRLNEHIADVPTFYQRLHFPQPVFRLIQVL